MASLSLMMLMIASASALPFPQLTEEQFSARARSLDKPNNVLITNSYTQVHKFHLQQQRFYLVLQVYKIPPR